MRVLHVHSGNMYGGVETLLTTLAAEGRSVEDFEQTFAVCSEGRLSKELRACGAKVTVLGDVRLSRPGTVLQARSALRSLIRQTKPDAVVTHSAWAQVVFGRSARPRRVPVMLWVHDALYGQHWLQRLARFSRPDLALCNSRYTEGVLHNVYPSVDSTVLYSPVTPIEASSDLQSRDEVRSELGTPSDAVVIIQVSRMEPYKGQSLHLDALGRIRDLPGWECWQVGGAQRYEEEQYLEGLRRQARQLGISERVRFLGQRSDVRRLLRAADIHCQPNVGPEPFGITFVEALSAGLPVVTTGIGGALEIIDENCGILVQPDDPEALAEALQRLIENPALRSELAAAGPQRAQELTQPQRQMDSLRSTLERLVEQAR